MSNGTARGLRVLVIEDNALVRNTAANVLPRVSALRTSNGMTVRMHVTAVDSAAAALAHLSSGARTDLILCDYYIPDVKGDELVDTLRARYPEIPLIVISAAEQEVLDGLRGRGAHAVLAKPLRLTQVVTPIALIFDLQVVRRAA